MQNVDIPTKAFFRLFHTWPQLSNLTQLQLISMGPLDFCNVYWTDNNRRYKYQKFISPAGKGPARAKKSKKKIYTFQFPSVLHRFTSHGPSIYIDWSYATTSTAVPFSSLSGPPLAMIGKMMR